MHPTKQKIIDAAVQRFNETGIANVRLQHIGDQADYMSVGNLAYHYRNKEAIVQAIWEQLAQKQRDLMAEFRTLPLFEDIERLLASLFKLQQNYRFFYADTLEVMRAYPDIQEAHRQHIGWQEQQIEMALHFNQARGALSAERYQGQYGDMANQFWLSADLWMYRQQVRGRHTTDYPAFRACIWALIRPFFTDVGAREFEQLNLILEKIP